jgi:transcription elongation factor GreA
MPATTKNANPNINVSEAMGRYGASLKPEDKEAQQQELNRFVRWFERRPMSEMSAQEVEKYQEEFEKTGADSRRLEPIKQFLAFSHKQGFTDINYGKFVRIRRTTTRGRPGTRASGEQTVEMPTGEILTAEGFERLQEELDQLINVKRPEIARDLFEARIDKDFRENAPYDAAKQHQAEVESRIRQLQGILARAQILDGGQPASGRVALGCKVKLRDLTHDEELEYTLVSANEANPRLGRISVASPVGKALIDHIPGETVDIEAPAGTVKMRIEAIEN